MKIEAVHSDQLHTSLAPISHAIKANGMLFVSGKIGLARDGTRPGDVSGEMRQAMENFGACLAAAGCSFENGDLFLFQLFIFMLKNTLQW